MADGMGGLTLEQQQARARAKARKRKMEAEGGLPPSAFTVAPKPSHLSQDQFNQALLDSAETAKPKQNNTLPGLIDRVLPKKDTQSPGKPLIKGPETEGSAWDELREGLEPFESVVYRDPKPTPEDLVTGKTPERELSRLGSAAVAVPDLLTFGFGDELGNFATGMDDEGAMNDLRDKAYKDNPVTAIAAGTAASLIPWTPKGGVLNQFINQGKNLRGKALRSSAVGAGLGAFYGAGSGEDSIEDRAKSAATLGAFGGVAGGVAPPVLAGANHFVVQPGFRALKGVAAHTEDAARKVVGADPVAVDRHNQKVAEAAVKRSMDRSGKTPEQAFAELESLKDRPAVMADIAGQDAENTLAGLTRRDGSTSQKAVDIIAERRGGMVDRLQDDLRRTSGIDRAEIDDMVKLMERQGQQRAAPLYTDLYERFRGIDSDYLRMQQQSGVLGRKIKAAQQAVTDEAIANGRDPKAISMMEVYDLAHRSLNDDIGRAVAKGEPESARRLAALQGPFVQHLDEMTGGAFAQARDVGGVAPRARAARKQGRQSFGARPASEINAKMAATREDARPAFKAGAVEALGNKLDQPSFSPNRYLAPVNQNKLKTVLGEDRGEQMVEALRAEAGMMRRDSRWNPNVGSVTSQAQGGSVAGMAEGLADAASLATSAKTGFWGFIPQAARMVSRIARRAGYSEKQLDAIGDLLLSNPEEGLRRLGMQRPANPPPVSPGGAAAAASGGPTPPPSGTPPSSTGPVGPPVARQGFGPNALSTRPAIAGAAGGAIVPLPERDYDGDGDIDRDDMIKARAAAMAAGAGIGKGAQVLSRSSLAGIGARPVTPQQAQAAVSRNSLKPKPPPPRSTIQPDDMGFITSAERAFNSPPKRFKDAKALTPDQWRNLFRDGGAGGEAFEYQIEPALRAIGAKPGERIPRDVMQRALGENRVRLSSDRSMRKEELSYDPFVDYPISSRIADSLEYGALSKLPDRLRTKILDAADNHIDKMYSRETSYSDYIARGPASNYKQEVITLPAEHGKGYKSHNWETENPVGHIRTTDRVSADGQRFRMVEELQSDLHQEGAKHGYYRSGQSNIKSNQPAVDRAESRFNEWQRSLPDNHPDKRLSPYEVLQKSDDATGKELARTLRAEMDRRDYNQPAKVRLPPDAPLKRWERPFVRRAVQQAAKDGHDLIAFPRHETLHTALQTEGTRKFYDERLPQTVKAVAKELGGTVERIKMSDGREILAIRLPKDAQRDLPRRGVVMHGLPAGLGGVGLAYTASQQPVGPPQ